MANSSQTKRVYVRRALVPRHPSWKVYDSSKLKTFETCPRKFFYKYRLGWESLKPNVNLVHGAAIHNGMEELYRAKADEGIFAAGSQRAYLAYLEEYTKSYNTDEDWDYNSPKNPEGASECFNNFPYELDKYKLIGTEVYGSVPISARRSLVGKLDVLLETEDGVMVIDHKTSKNALKDYTVDEHSTSIQFHTYYLIGMMYALAKGYSLENFQGILINYLTFGKNKARGVYCDFDRFLIKHTIPQLQQFMQEMNQIIDLIEWNDALLRKDKQHNNSMIAFPRRLSSCMDFYKRCSFFDFCKHTQNPLRFAKQVQPGFKINFWDPRGEKGKLVKLKGLS